MSMQTLDFSPQLRQLADLPMPRQASDRKALLDALGRLSRACDTAGLITTAARLRAAHRLAQEELNLLEPTELRRN